MEQDKKLFLDLINSHKNKNLEFFLHFKDNIYPIKNVTISESSAPVRKPTVRGGVYFSDVLFFNLKGTINDSSIIPLLSDTMLGPNSEFKDLKVETKIPENGRQIELLLVTNLTNTMQSSSCVELNMRIIKVLKK